MTEFIFAGIAVLLAVNGLYSRFCEKPKEGTMSDLIFVAVIVLFFIVSGLYVRFCEKL